ncbi:hypothetical protein [Burkholderia lata]|uniref:hypothetical protein n=1 Tax=Burkholderia lata (strain ATCC 17760 / DSM 23089 / LMG 22485 / NCIMB 9086 / R18194 / 383) TaxID=482957 RepID=UPI001582332D|nr:hypothetical protein [Burkholderia lata]
MQLLELFAAAEIATGVRVNQDVLEALQKAVPPFGTYRLVAKAAHSALRIRRAV